MLKVEDIDFEGLRKWQQEGQREVNIRFGSVANPGLVSVWVYDYSIATGQFLKTGKIEEIDLITARKEELARFIEEFKKLEE